MIKTNWTNTVPMSLVGMATSTQATAKRKLTEPANYDVCVCRNCEYEETAFVAASGEGYKNDKKSFIEKRVFSTDTITFKLMKAGAVVATLNASTYGTLYNFADPLFLDFTDYKGFLVDWYLVKQAFGYGVYKIRTEIVSLGVTYTKDSHNFGVREYNSLRADGTVKIESYQNGNLTKYFDFTGLNWYQSTRIQGYFGHKTPTLVLNQMEDYQRRVHEIQSQIIDKYYMSTELLQSEIFNYLNYNGLRANTLLITDYNLQNQELYRQLEVYWSNIEEATSHNETRLANFVYEFKNRINDDIKRNPKGDKGSMPFQPSSVVQAADVTAEIYDRWGNQMPDVVLNQSGPTVKFNEYNFTALALSREAGWNSSEASIIIAAAAAIAANFYKKIIGWWPNRGTTASCHRWNFKHPYDTNASNRTLFNSTTHGANGIQFNGFSWAYPNINLQSQSDTYNIGIGFYITSNFATAGDNTFFESYDNIGQTAYLGVNSVTGNVYYKLFGAADTYTMPSVPADFTGKRFVLKRDGADMKLFIDGTLVKTTAAPAFTLATSGYQRNNTFKIGGNGYGSDPLTCKLGNIYFETDMTAAEITAFDTIIVTLEASR